MPFPIRHHGTAGTECDPAHGFQRVAQSGQPADFVGIKVPNRYVFGFGMDVKGAWRNLPEIYALDPGS